MTALPIALLRNDTSAGFYRWLLAVVVALCAQLCYWPLQQPVVARLLYPVAIAFALWAARDAPWDHRRPDAPAMAPRPGTGLWVARPGVAQALRWVAIVGGLGSWLLVTAPTGYTLAVVGWLVALIAAVLSAGFWPQAGVGAAVHQESGWSRRDFAVLAGLLILGAALRVPALNVVPADVHGDEGLTGLGGIRVIEGDFPPFAGVNRLGNIVHTLPLLAFGPSLEALRLASVAEGMLALLLTYLLGRRLLGPLVAGVATFLLATAAWDVHFSRNGASYIQAQFVTVLLIWLADRALWGRRALDYLLLGFAAAACLNVYYAARFAPVVVVAMIVYRGVTEPGFIRTHGKLLLVSLAAFALFMAPQIPAYVDAPGRPTSRPTAVFLLTPDNLQHALATQNGDALQMAIAQVRRTLEGFTFSGETSQQYFHRGAPLFDTLTAVLLVLGAAIAAVRIRRYPYFLLSVWVWGTLLVGSVLTVDPPFGPRLVALIPGLALLAAVAVEFGVRGAERRLGGRARPMAVAAAAAGAAFVLVANVHDYFVVHITQRQPPTLSTTLSRLILAQRDEYSAYLVAVPATVAGESPTFRYLTARVPYTALSSELSELPIVPTGDRGAMFLMLSESPGLGAHLERLRRSYPSGRVEQVVSTRGQPYLTVYYVDRAAVGRG